jgi:hypothetical protein
MLVGLLDMKYPRNLARACMERGRYALALRDAGVITFSFAEPGGKGWVRLYDIEPVKGPSSFTPIAPCLDGLDVKMSSILWVQEVDQ